MIKINLLREPTSRTKLWVPRKSRDEIYLGLFIALAIAGTAYWHWHRAGQLEEAKALQADLQLQSSQVATVRAELARLTEVKISLEERSNAIERLKTSQKGPVRLMNAVISSVPAGPRLWLTRLTQERENIKIEGQAFDVPSIADFIARLSQTPPFGAVELDYWQVNERSVNFELSCSLGMH
jgi:Tfp pilus assembly protein PilN